VRPLDSEQLRRHPALALGNILDIRPTRQFEARHLIGAVCVPVTGPGTVERHLPSLFLPPRHEPLLLVAETTDLAEAVVAELNGRGRPRIDFFVLTADSATELPAEILATGPSRGHLWRPPGFLADHADRLPPPDEGPVLDLGCGGGRAAVWLAERGYRVTGLDADPEAIELARRLAASRQVTCDFKVRKLGPGSSLPAGPWSIVLAFRFLDRDVLGQVRRELPPGGVVVVRTFWQAPGFSGPPSDRYRLQPGELLELFGSFEVLVHDQGHDPDGKPAAGIVARKPGGE
jgi:SAM-dependent methyltransferase